MVLPFVLAFSVTHTDAANYDHLHSAPMPG